MSRWPSSGRLTRESMTWWVGPVERNSPSGRQVARSQVMGKVQVCGGDWGLKRRIFGNYK